MSERLCRLLCSWSRACPPTPLHPPAVLPMGVQAAYDYLRSVCADVTVTQGDFDESTKWPDTQVSWCAAAWCWLRCAGVGALQAGRVCKPGG